MIVHYYIKLMVFCYKTLINTCFPHICILCHNKIDQDLDLCKDCLKNLPYSKQSCLKCAKPLMINDKICGECLRKAPNFDYIFSLCRYEHPMSALITQLKFHQKLANAEILGQLMSKKLLLFYKNHQNITSLPECIIPVPLHPKRLQERGFNQALELSKSISKKLNLPIDRFSTNRVRNTLAQTLVPAKKRKKNVKNAFKIEKNLSFKHVVIVDDVVTTSNTVNELARILKKNGVETIGIWCCARVT